MKKSLMLKTTLMFVLISVCMILFAGSFLSFSIMKTGLSEFYQNCDAVFEEISADSKMLEYYSSAGDYDSVYAFAMKFSDKLAINGDRELSILDGSGNYLLGSGNENAGFIGKNTYNIINGNQKLSYEYASENMTRAYAVKVSGNTKYIINITDNKKEMNLRLRNLFMILIECMILLLLLSVFFAYLFSKYITKPIEKLKTGADKISRGDYDYIIDTKSSDEIGELEQAFNAMAVQVKNTVEIEKMLNAKQKTFIADASHELRTPLTAVKSYAEAVIEDENMPEDTRKQFLSVIKNESERMTLITEKLLTLAKLDNNAVSEKENADVAEIVKSVILSVRSRADLKNIDFDVAVEKFEVFINKNELFEMIENLITNAIKYTRENDIISVKSEKNGENYIVKVIDHGEGISKENTEKIFDRFYRVDKARSRKNFSFGLGLPIVKELTEKNNIEIKVESELGKGSTFMLLFKI